MLKFLKRIANSYTTEMAIYRSGVAAGQANLTTSDPIVVPSLSPYFKLVFLNGVAKGAQYAYQDGKKIIQNN